MFKVIKNKSLMESVDLELNKLKEEDNTDFNFDDKEDNKSQGLNFNVEDKDETDRDEPEKKIKIVKEESEVDLKKAISTADSELDIDEDDEEDFDGDGEDDIDIDELEDVSITGDEEITEFDEDDEDDDTFDGVNSLIEATTDEDMMDDEDEDGDDIIEDGDEYLEESSIETSLDALDTLLEEVEILEEGLFSKKEAITNFNQIKNAVSLAMKSLSTVEFVNLADLTDVEKKSFDEIFPSVLGSGLTTELRKKTKVNGKDIVYFQRKGDDKITSVIGYKHGKASYHGIPYKKFLKVKKEEAEIVLEDLDMNLEVEILEEGLFSKKEAITNFNQIKNAVSLAMKSSATVEFVNFADLTDVEKKSFNEVLPEVLGSGTSTEIRKKTKVNGKDIAYFQRKNDDKITSVIGFRHGKQPYTGIAYKKFMKETKKEETEIVLEDLDLNLDMDFNEEVDLVLEDLNLEIEDNDVVLEGLDMELDFEI